MRADRILLLALAVAGLSSAGLADDWPQFRGPNAAGIAGEKGLPSEWGPDKNVAWKVKVPGVAWSSPIISGDKVILTTAITENQRKPQAGGGFGGGRPPGGGGRPPGGFGRGGGSPPNALYRWEIHCLDRATGKTLWTELALEAKPRIPTHGSNTFATETPVTDGERVYAYFGMHGVFCLDLSGKLVWKKDLGSYPMQMGWGTASSPALDEKRLFLQIDNEEKSFLVALDKKSGAEVWRATRDEQTNWGSPILWKNRQRTELVAMGSRKVRSYDPSSGKVLWELAMGGGRCCSTPVGDAEHLYLGAEAGMGGMGGFGGGGFGGRGRGDEGGGGLFAVRAGASGDITLKSGSTSNAGVAWSQPKGGPEMASPLVFEGHLYILSRNGGIVTCHDAKTGKQVYKERLPGARAFWASPWAGDGKVFCPDDAGTTYVLQAGPEFKVLAQNSLNEMLWSSPAAVGGAVYLRGVDHLYCIKP